MSLPDTPDRGPHDPWPVPAGVSPHRRITRLAAGIALALGALLTLICITGSTTATASPARFQAGPGDNDAGPTPTCTLSYNYVVTVSAGATMIPANNYVPGTSCSNCVQSITVPFNYQWYDLGPRNFAYLSSEGNFQVFSNSASGNNLCLPQGTLIGAIMPYWDDLDTNINDTMGYFTALVGTAPDRIYVIRYHGGKQGSDSIVDYELLLYEGQPRFDIIYGRVDERGYAATIGVQGITGGDGRWTTFSCNAQSINQGTRLRFDRRVCPTGR